jgi:hypothetical protein
MSLRDTILRNLSRDPEAVADAVELAVLSKIQAERQRDAYAETLREIDRSGMVGNFIHKRHAELAGNKEALPPSVGSGEGSTNQ